MHHAVDEVDGFQILRAHDVLVVDLQFGARLGVADGVGATAQLHAFAAVGRTAHVVEAEVALAADSHAEGAVAEHLDAHRPSAGARDVLFLNLPVDFGHLLHL